MMNRISLRRGSWLVGAAVALSLCCSFSDVRAEAPLVGSQVAGYYRMMLGQYEVTALSDGFIELEPGLLKNISADEINSLLKRMFADTAKIHTAVNSYLINTGSKLVLVDAGAGNIFGPVLGGVVPNLKASGYDPSQVDAVIITHMHGDHVGGLVGAEGKSPYPNATIYVAKAESDFWLSPAEAEKAPAEEKVFFKMAHDLADPQIAAGRWKTFVDGEELFPGAKARLIPGHTPGHTTIEVGSAGESLWITGDLVHCMAVQFPRPNVAIDFDLDQKQAVTTRQALFKRAAERKVFVAGMHLPFPGIGRMRAEGSGGYVWVPIEFGSVKSAALTPAVESIATAVPISTSVPTIGTPIPVAVPLLSKPPEVILAINKPVRKTPYPGNVVYTLPKMDEVLLANELAYHGNLKVDIYYPPNYNFETKLPIVILAHGFQETDEFDKDMPQHMDWARLIAVSGMIAISAQAGDSPVDNFYRVFDFLIANKDLLGLDLSRIGFWAVSGQGAPAIKALQDEKLAFRDAFKAAVFLYSDFRTAIPSAWPKTLSLFVVKAGSDQAIPGPTIDNFVAQARASQIATEYIELADAPHGFDVFQNTQASKTTIRQALEFLKGRLLP
jgi:glyoxylase-like metal-dependent hydrolase (beta-lactamase superfamily II)